MDYSKPEALRAQPTYRLTIVDDSDEFVSMMREVLAGRYEVIGIQAESTEDVAEARPDVIMVDLNPRAEKLRVLWRTIGEARAHPMLRHVPIILCAPRVDGSPEVEQALHHPLVQLLTKPFTLDALDAALARAMADKDLAS